MNGTSDIPNRGGLWPALRAGKRENGKDLKRRLTVSIPDSNYKHRQQPQSPEGEKHGGEAPQGTERESESYLSAVLASE